MKVACERVVLDGAASAMVIRPGLIVGPEDPTGRFSYWPRRLAAGGEVLAPGDPGRRDAGGRRPRPRGLGRRLRASSGRPVSSTASGEPCPCPSCSRSAPRASTARSPGPGSTRRSSPSRGSSRGWARARSRCGSPARSTTACRRTTCSPPSTPGLTIRPLAETTRDTLAWLDATPDAPVTGITWTGSGSCSRFGTPGRGQTRRHESSRPRPRCRRPRARPLRRRQRARPGGRLKTCNDYIKAKNISCTKASGVAEEGLARLLDANATWCGSTVGPASGGTGTPGSSGAPRRRTARQWW